MGEPFDHSGEYGGAGPGGADDPIGLEGAEEGPDGEPIPEGKQLRDSLLFVIDCSSPGALEPREAGGRSVLGEAIHAAIGVLKTKVLTSPDDRVGVVFYGVREKVNPHGFEGIRVVQELERPTPQRIKHLQQEAMRTPAQFEERYGYGREVTLSEVFWTCTSLFNTKVDDKLFQSRVFLFTSNDSPCKNAGDQLVAEQRAQDMLETGVDLEFFPVLPTGGVFSIERFWGRVLPVDESDYVAQSTVRVEELERRVRRRLHRKRTLQRLSLEICPGVEMAVSIFVHILLAKAPPPVYLLNENNKPLKSETRNICEQTGSILHPADDIETFVELAGERVYMSRDETQEMKRLGEPGMRLLGFKKKSHLRPFHRIFHSYFVYPNDRAISGSAALTSALLDSMLLKDQVALVLYIPRKNSTPVLAALLPQAEREDGSDQICPPGFHMVLLPWGEEIRELSFPAPEAAPAPSPELADAARQVVRAMRLEGFAPGCVENPHLQKHYAAVQALALGEDKPEETVDMLRPDEGALSEKAPLVDAWRSAIDAAAPAGGRLGARDDLGERPAKVARREAPAAPPASVEAMRELVASNEVERLTAPVLKEWLRVQGCAITGKKADLVERVRAVV